MDSTELSKTLGPMFEGLAKDGATVLNALGLAKDAAILDVGTGSGKFAIFLALQGYQVLTGEPSTDTSHYAGKNWEADAKSVGVLDRIRFQAFDAGDMPFDGQTFDAVFFYGVLHHVDEAARRDVMREALRVAKRGGAVVYFEPNQQTLEKLWVDDPDHPLAATPSDYLAQAGIQEQRIPGVLMDIFIYKKAA